MSTKSLFVTVLCFLFVLFPRFIQAADPTKKSATKESTISSHQEKDPARSQEEIQAQKDLDALRSKPKEFRVLVLGVQIFLGRFGYGTGPFTGELDQTTSKALRAYQKYVKLPETGDIDFRTLQSLTDDNLALDQPVPFLPQATFDFKEWDARIQIQGTWVHKDAPTHDSIHTAKISCFREKNHCIESTSILLDKSVPVLEVLTHVYTIKEWDDEKLVTAPYEGEPCTVSIVRINRKQQSAFRFSAYHKDKGVCAKVQTEDVQYHLVNGQQVYLHLKQRKAEDTKRILRVEE